MPVCAFRGVLDVTITSTRLGLLKCGMFRMGLNIVFMTWDEANTFDLFEDRLRTFLN